MKKVTSLTTPSRFAIHPFNALKGNLSPNLTVRQDHCIAVLRSYSLMVFYLFCLFQPSVWAQTKADTIHVSHYDIHLEIRNFEKKEINGYTNLEMVSKMAPLPRIYLHLWGLTVDSVKKGENHIDFSHFGQQLKIEQPFASVGQTETVRVYYHGKPKQDASWGGFFFSGDFAFNMGVGMASYPHSFGRVWFPCIDEFTDKSTYTFNIITDADKKAVCGGMLTDSTNLGDKIVWKWELPNPIPTYLASVAVGKYKAYKDTFLSVSGEVLPIEIYADSATLLKVPGSFVNLKKFIHTYENRWGPCRWQRVGYVAVPFAGGAMEHATNIAYPKSAVTGNTFFDDLISHELAHFWFGNLITCSNSQNMWINEGFARYGEYLCYEALDPTLQKYKTEIRKLHMEVLSKDDGVYALDNIPPSNTYNSDIVYDKGGLVAYTLRNYMGDDLFFSSIKQFLYENQYSNVTSEEFFQKLAQISGMTELNDFYLGWVHQPGTFNFNIDSLKLKEGSSNIYQVAFKQRLYNAHSFANNNKVDVEFVSASGERKLIERINFSGESDRVEVELPFEPVFWTIDPNGKMGDYCYDYTQIINKTGNTNWTDILFAIKVTEITDNAIFRIEYNPFTPTPAKNIHPDIIRISEKHFWRMGFLQLNDIKAEYTFSFSKSSESVLLEEYSLEHLVLLYRKDAAHDWQIFPAKNVSGKISGKLVAKEILPGEYTFGIRNKLNIKDLENCFKIFPNPTSREFKIQSSKYKIQSVEVYDIFGRKLYEYNNSYGLMVLRSYGLTTDGVVIDLTAFPTGIYFVKITTETGMVIKKVIKN